MCSAEQAPSTTCSVFTGDSGLVSTFISYTLYDLSRCPYAIRTRILWGRAVCNGDRGFYSLDVVLRSVRILAPHTALRSHPAVPTS